MTDLTTVEDWLRTRTWDLYTVTHELVTTLDQLKSVLGDDPTVIAHFLELPAAEAMLTSLRHEAHAYAGTQAPIPHQVDHHQDAVTADALLGYSEEQPRDDHGRFGEGGDHSHAAGPVPPGAQLREFVTPTMGGFWKPESIAKEVAAGRLYAVECKDGSQAVLMVQDNVPKNQVPTGEEAQIALSTLADLHDQYGAASAYGGGAPQLTVVSKAEAADRAGGARGAMAYYDPRYAGTINLVGRESFKGVGGRVGWFMPTSREVGVVRATITHEYGHLQEATIQRDGAGRIATFKAISEQPKMLGMSKYGQTNAHEAYAEAFQEWHQSGGQTTNQAAQVYAEKFGWK